MSKQVQVQDGAAYNVQTLSMPYKLFERVNSL